MFPGSHENPNNLIWNTNISLKEFSKSDLDLAVTPWLSHGFNDETQVSNLPVNVSLCSLGPFSGFGAFLGPAVAFVSFVQACGHGQFVVKLFTEGIQLLRYDVLVCPFLPSVLQAANGTVLPMSFDAAFFVALVHAERDKTFQLCIS